VCRSVLHCMLQFVAVCCSVLQCVAVCRSVLHCMLQCVAVFIVTKATREAVYRSVLQYVLQCVAVFIVTEAIWDAFCIRGRSGVPSILGVDFVSEGIFQRSDRHHM